MRERRRIVALILIMIFSCLVVGGITISLLYNAALGQQRARLVDIVRSRANFMDAVARFDAVHSPDYPGGAEAATLSQVIDAHEQFTGFGETGEFTLAKREGESIVFLLRHHHYDLVYPGPVPLDSNLAEPMRLALQGLSGSMVGVDNRGEAVLAAYQPLKELNLGIVAKIDMAEIREPFVRAGTIAGAAALAVVALGSVLFLRVSNPIIRRLSEYSAQMEGMVDERTRDLQRLQERFSGLFNSCKDAIGFADLEGKLLEVNDPFCGLSGYSRQELLSGMTYPNITPDEYCGIEDNMVGKMLRAGKPVEYEKEYVKKDGSRVPIQVTTFLVKGEDGNPIGRASIIRDITETRRMQEKLLASERLAILGQFSGSISHELRNPLGVIDSSVFFLKAKLGNADEKVTQHLDRIKSNVAGAIAIIDSLLNLTRLKEPQMSWQGLAAIAADVIGAFQVPEAVKVTRNFPEQEVLVSADREQLSMAFRNIIINAIEAMDGKGTLAVVVRWTEDGRAEISFADTGPGIDPENLEKVFQPLFSTKARGIGFGLSITRLVIDKHGGTIEAIAQPGQGAVIIARFPLYIRGSTEE